MEKFGLSRLNPSPAAINFTKLDHFHGLHLRNLPTDELSRLIKPFFESAGLKVNEEKLNKITPMIQERIATVDEAVDIAGFFFREKVEPAVEDLVAKNLTAARSAELARWAYDILSTVDSFTSAAAETPMRAVVKELGVTPGQFFGILREAVTGQKVSPPLFVSMEIIGK